jgi:large subunit ribosomal protein L5
MAKTATAKKPAAATSGAVPRLQKRFEDEILPAMREKFGRTNRLSLPRIEKIVVSMGVGSAIADKKHIEEAVSAMSEITGQKPLVCKARKSIANFRLREGLAIGCKTTLRGARMYEFLDRLVSLALPRVRDFRGLNPKAFDGHGNYSLGLTEQLVFPELNPDKYLRPQGMNIAICCSAGSDDESREMLKMFGLPFKTDETGGRRAADN